VNQHLPAQPEILLGSRRSFFTTEDTEVTEIARA
jgi:hypothetical protein